MITSARPHLSESAHWYYPDGRACHQVPCKSRPGEMRDTDVRDARKLGLLPSVTSITKVLHRQALVEWQIEQSVLAALTTPKRDDEELDAYIERVLHTEKHQDQERDAAAERGRQIHEALSLAMRGEQYCMSDYIFEPVQFLRKLGRTMASEQTVIGDDYAGTLDLKLQNDMEIWVIDYKTTSKLPDKQYDEHKLQLGAYAGALGNTGDLRIRCANLYISTKEVGQWKMIESERWLPDFSRFKLLCQFFKMTNNL